MADIKALKDAVWLKQQAIKAEEGKLAEWEGVVGFVQGVMFNSADVANSSPTVKR
jgi:hypothetical protein